MVGKLRKKKVQTQERGMGERYDVLGSWKERQRDLRNEGFVKSRGVGVIE
jgi:hypothetical protein